MHATPKTAKANLRHLKPTTRKLGLNQATLLRLALIPNPTKTARRIQELISLGVPTKAIVKRAGLPEKDYAELIVRLKSKYKLNRKQQDLFYFMIKKGIKEEIAASIASSKAYNKFIVPEKIAYFESLNLDPKKYGVTKLPPEIYQHLLKYRPSLIKRAGLRKALRQLEDRHAIQILDNLFPNWRKVRTFFQKGKKRRPSTILKHLREHIQAGLEPGTGTLFGTLKRARRISGAPFRGTAKLFAGSEYEKERAKERARQERIRQLEEQISTLNQRIETEQNLLHPQTSGIEERQRLIRERDDLLFGTTQKKQPKEILEK